MTPFWRRRVRAPLPVLTWAHATEKGTYPVNEDAFGEVTCGGLSLFGVADGLGGHERGEIASRLAIDTCIETFCSGPSMADHFMRTLFDAANEVVVRADSSDATGSGMGLRTTLALLATDGRRACWGHVGDTRLYHFRNGRVLCRTRDHSVPEMLYRAGDIGEQEIRGHPERNRLLVALGQDPPPPVTISKDRGIEAGDSFLLCSDGWWEVVEERHMEEDLAAASAPAEWIELMAARIVRADQARQDNYTALAVCIGEGTE